MLLSMKEKSLAGDITAGIRIKIHCPMRRLQPSARPAKKWGTGGWKAAPSITLEPCQMCSGAIVQARITEVVMGCMNPKAGCGGSILNILEMPQFNHQVKVTRGILGEECSRMLTTFFKELRIRNKMGTSV